MGAFRHRGLLALALVVLAPALTGATYKWVDARGQVHYSDAPPPPGTAYELVAAPHPVPAPPEPVAAPPAAAQPVPALPAQREPPPVASTRDDARCVDALFQLQVLQGDWKVYMAGPGDERAYLDDRDRPAEIERLARERDAACSDDPRVLAAQKGRAGQLFQAMSPDCLEAREKLRNLQRPTAKSAPSDIEKQQAWIASHCPDLHRDAVWLADWRYPKFER
jgi:hypothetical protein